MPLAVTSRLRAGRQYAALPGGLLGLPEDLRPFCAAWEDGRVLVQTGRQYDPLVGGVMEYLATTYSVTPYAEQATPQQIADQYLAAEDDGDAGLDATHKRRVAALLGDAAEMRASDIKIIGRSRSTDIRMAVAGREISYRDGLTVADGQAMIAYLFDARDEGSGHTTQQRSTFQSFSITPGHTIPLPDRIQKLRGQKGYHEGDAGILEHLVLRIVFHDNPDVARLEELGLDPVVLADLGNASARLKGAVIFGGETGDGKSTTIIRAVERLYDAEQGQIGIVTVEDPVEIRIRRPGVIQIPVQSAGSAEERLAEFRKALMHFVRVNPHVGVVSEVRDAEGARQMIQFIETGHQVWTTIHIGSVNSILFRMIDMGVHPTELAKPGSISLLAKQSLIPLLCSCALKDGGGPFRFRNESGCGECLAGRGGREAAAAWAGYRRLVAVAETIVPDDGYLDCVRRNDAIAAMRHWRAPLDAGGLAGLTLSDKLNALANAGLVAPADARKKGADVCPMDPAKLANFRKWIDDLA